MQEPTAAPDRTFIPKHVDDLLSKITGRCSEPGDREWLVQIVEEWLTTGGNPDAVFSDEDEPTNVNRPTLLQMAACDAHHVPVRVFELLIRHGASMSPTTKGGSPLCNAVFNLSVCERTFWHAVAHVQQVVRMLFEAGARDSDERVRHALQRVWTAAADDGILFAPDPVASIFPDPDALVVTDRLRS